MYSTQVSQLVKAPRSAVYRALLDPTAVARWRVPTGMSGHVHEFDKRPLASVAKGEALATAHQGQGLGPEALRLVIGYLIEERGHHRLTIDPAAHNERAIRAYARIGFRPVGVLRRYERAADGSWHDGLLMDLLADELL